MQLLVEFNGQTSKLILFEVAVGQVHTLVKSVELYGPD